MYVIAIRGNELTEANEAILALVDFPKQIVQALSTAVNHMKGIFQRRHS